MFRRLFKRGRKSLQTEYVSIRVTKEAEGDESVILILCIQLLLSWLLLYLFSKKHIYILGFTPIKKRIIQGVSGFIIYGLVCAAIQYIDSVFTKTIWTINENISYAKVLELFWLDMQSVLFEELLFRGALLYLLIQWIGDRKGIIISALGFGIYHWFTFGVIGNIPFMILVLIMTGIPGIMFAYSFVKTKSIALPIGLHLGWNFTVNSIFGTSGWHESHILHAVKGVDKVYSFAGVPLNYIVNVGLSNFILPVLTIFIIKYFYSRNGEQLGRIE
jgi:uncharacterized protein